MEKPIKGDEPWVHAMKGVGDDKMGRTANLSKEEASQSIANVET